MNPNPYFLTPADQMAADTHLATSGGALVLHMVSGRAMILTELTERIHGRISGRDPQGSPVFVDPAKVEAFTFATADDEGDVDEPAAEIDTATEQEITLLVEREGAIEALVSAAKSGLEVDLAVSTYEAVTDRLQVAREQRKAVSSFSARALEQGGYDGAPAEIGSDEPSAVRPPSAGRSTALLADQAPTSHESRSRT